LLAVEREPPLSYFGNLDRIRRVIWRPVRNGEHEHFFVTILIYDGHDNGGWPVLRAFFTPAATSTSPTRGRGKLLHLAMAGRAMITRFDAPWQDVQRIP